MKVNQSLPGSYKVITLLEQNRLREVALAMKPSNSEIALVVAISVPDEDAEQFERQIKVLDGLRHPHIAKFIDQFVDADLHYVITAYPKMGKPLSELIHAGMVSEGHMQIYAAQLLDALAYCHAHGVVHRDIRPENIIVHRGNTQAMLVNFSLMKWTGGEQNETAQFAKGFGTLNYAPPEQLARGTDDRSDLYSLGATLYHALTGTSPQSAFERGSGDQLTRPRSINPDLSPTMEKIVLKSLNLDTAQRYQSASEFKSDLGQVDSPATRPVSFPVLPASNAKPSFRLMGVAAIIALVAIAAGVMAVLVFGFGREDSSAAAEARKTRVPTLAALKPTPVAVKVGATSASITATLSASPIPPAPTLAPAEVATPITLTLVPPAISPAVAAPADTPAPVTPAAPPQISGPNPIGSSALGKPIYAYVLGNGPKHRGLIGAIHGGYESNTALLMTKTLDYLRANPGLISPELTIHIIPIANPDGYAAGPSPTTGRMNGHNVDLNRNWDFQWNITATHGTRVVSAGSAAFSEPETQALRDYIATNNMDAVIFYHSAFNAVFSGAGQYKDRSVALAKEMAKATRYRYRPEGVVGQLTTGDSIDYLTDQSPIAAIEIELLTHGDIDWTRNLDGLKAFLKWDLAGQPNPQATTVATASLGKEVPTTEPKPVDATTCGKSYVVKPGDTLSVIAVNCGLAATDADIPDVVEKIKKLNNLPNDNINLGDKLKLP